MPFVIKTGVLNMKDETTSTYTNIDTIKGDKGDPGPPGALYSDDNNDGHIVITPMPTNTEE